MIVVQILSALLIQLTLIRCELFTSTTHLTELLTTEIGLATKLDVYLKEEYERLHRIEKFTQLIKDEIRQAQGNEEYHFGNPVNAHLFIKHLTAEWETVEKMLPKDLTTSIAKNWLFPSPEDYTGSALALMRLQDTYKLTPSQLANGEISVKFKSKRLNALECYDLGRVAYTNGDFYHTLMWMQEALVHLETERKNGSMNKIDILDHLAFATSQQGNVEHALAITEEILTIAPNHMRARNNKIYYEKIIRNRTLTEEQQQQRHSDSKFRETIDRTSVPMRRKEKTYRISNERPDDLFEEREIYEQLCRQNGSVVNATRQASLFCRYRHNNHPYLILQPVKEEQLLDRPAIFMFHDVVSHADIDEIKALASPRLQRAVVRDAATDTFKPAEYRISKSAWLRNEDSPVIIRLSRLIEAVTNLTMSTAEDLQIANYGIGGHYEPHFDFARQTETDAFPALGAGNRIATWLTYMSDVEQGGATVFPSSGGHLKPRKGSAAFWYNLHASGAGDHSTRHAACPVLIGNKWVANKWIHERGQEFRRPCSLDRTA